LFESIRSRGDSLLYISHVKNVIAQFVVWENPNPNNKCVKKLWTPITVTPIDIPLVLVMDGSNTRDASRVNLGGLQGERPRDEGTTQSQLKGLEALWRMSIS
jgi:hypothetical protein